MPRLLRLLLAVTLLFTTLPVTTLWPARTAYALNSGGVTEVVTALQSLGTVVNSLSGLAGLGEPIPFTDVDPSEALNLDTLLSDALGALGAPSSLADLATVIDGKDNPNLGGTGISVQFDNVVGNDTNDTLAFDFTATRTMNLPLKFSGGEVNLDGSDIAVTFSLTAPFAFGYDGGASNPSEKVFLTNEPIIAVTASANVPAITAFESLLGFTSVSVGGSLALNVALTVAFADPDENGRLTMDEWSSTALGDLVAVAFADATGNDIDGNLALDASIVPGPNDATVSWVDATLTDGPGSPVVTLNALDDFTNINASDIFGGLASATTALLAAQQSGDLQLPFLKDSLSDIFRFADPLVNFVHELGDAAIVCGPSNTIPPSGPIFGLGSGDTVYCQAYTINPVSSVDWKIGGASSNADPNTVGPNPSATATLVLGAAVVDSVTLDFQFQGDPTPRVARPLFLTADQLTAKLLSVAGIDTVTQNYDAGKKILTYRLQESLPAVSKAIETDFGDQLKAQTGLFGLTQTGSDVITVEASGIGLDVTFGVILVTDPAAIKTGGTDSDRFFLQVGLGNEFQADVAIGAGSNFGLEGRLAFLKVAAQGVTTGPNPGGAIFSLNDSNDAPGVPSLALNIAAPGVTGVSLPEAIPNAILVSDLLSGGIDTKISAQCEVGLSSGLEVKATVGGATELASGKVGVSWPDVFTDGGCTPNLAGIAITTDGQFDTDLLSFNINPDNPLEMLSIILSSIGGFAAAVDALPAVGDLDVQIPVVGVSPRELLDKLEEINTVINDAAANPADTLQALEEQLETELGIAPSALSFELGDVGSATEKDLILRLGYSKADTITKPLNFDLNDGGLGLVSASNGGNLSFGYTAGAQFDVAIPLKLNSALADTLVLETTKATVGGALDAPSLSFTAAVGPLEVGITGQAKVDVDVVVENSSTSPLALTAWASGVGADLTGDPVDCGVVDVDPTPATDDKALTGQACARLDLDVAGPIGTLGFRAEDITTPDDLTTHAGWFVFIPPDLTTQIANNVLDWAFLFKVLPELTTKLEGMLAQGAEDVSVPGLGEALDAGADVVGVINTQVISPLSDIATAVDATNAGTVESSIKTKILSLGAIVLDRTNDNTVDASDVDVVARCGGADCADGAAVLSIDDVQVTFKIGQEVSTTPAFDIGIDGLPIGVTGATTAAANWGLILSLGLSKAEGPYIVANATPDPELNLGASVSLADNPAPGSCAADPSNPVFFPAGQFGGFSDTRCLEGTLAFLSVGLYDGNAPGGDDTDDPTNIGLTTTLDLTSSAPSGRLTAGNIINSVGLEPRFVAAANIDLALRTSIDVVDGLPGVVGAVHIAWSFDTNNPSLGAPDVAFDRLNLDAGAFISTVLSPVVTEVRKVTSPLEPIVDFIQAEVPVLTQLAELVGEEPVTVLSIIAASGGFDEDDLDLIDTVLQLIQLANNLPVEPGAGNLFIPLGSTGPGSFSLFGDKLLQGATTPDQAGTLISSSDAGSNLADELPGNNGVQALAVRRPGNAGVQGLATTRPGTFGVEGLTFPFLDDATQIFGLLLGKDVTIVRMDFGTFKASVSEGYEFGPIFIGPFPVTAEVGLAFTAEARFAMGYDTRGLRLVIAGGSPVKLFNGIFIDDLDYDGLDVEEWKLTFRVYAEAALDVLIVEAGVYGGVDAILMGNLDDRPNPDGKLYIDEIVDKLSNPICLFIISGKLDLFLGFFLEVDLFLWSDRWELEIIRVTLLDFTLGCEGENPNLADVSGGNLYLNIGTRANLRGIQMSVKDEEFTVRQIGSGKVSVEAFGIKQEESGITGVVIADAFDGDDIIAFVKGGDDVNPVAFTIGSDLQGGDGNDSFTGGDSVDKFSGGPGVDKLIGGKGNDILNGDSGDDRIDGGIGNDKLNGGPNNDTVTGGPGADEIDGGDGDDSLLGSPWTAANPDGVDTITGGPGNDNLDGGPEDDLLYGDETGLGCLADGAAPGGIDAILGGPGSDTIVGGNNDDRLIGQEGNDKLCGNGGNDILDGDDEDAATADAGDRDDSGGGGFAGGLFGGSGNDSMYGRGGDDQMYGGADDDDMFGGANNDTMNGEAGADEMYGEAGTDTMNGNIGNDTMYGGTDIDTMSGNEDDDTMYGDAGADIMFGNAGVDVMRGGNDDDNMQGNAGNDQMYGDSGADKMFGNDNDDLMRGGIGDDTMEGNDGVDTMYGDAGQDDMIGGSSAAGQPDAGDFMFGNAAQDVMAGDNATISRPAAPVEIDGTIVRSVTLHDLATGNGNTANAGNDDMQGDEGNDDMYGGGENDTLNGNAGDDMLEGNGAVDTLYGDAGQDDLIGGTSQGGGGQPDAADTIYGGSNGPDLPSDFDVIAGDNASITRAQNAGVYVTDDYAADTQDVVRRIVTLFDVATTSVTPGANTSGGDTLFGEGGFDLMYGQGADEIGMSGGNGNDEMYGNAGADVMLGNHGQDDLIGGTGRTKSDDPTSAVDGRLDGADAITGGNGDVNADTDDYDVVLGDNATAFRTRDAGTGFWVTNTFNNAIARTIRFYDVGTVASAPGAGVSGGDTLRGEDNDDTMYGQGGDDDMQGDGGDDYMEGNAGTDTMSGNVDNDDMTGGTGRINDDPATGTNGRLDANDFMYGHDGFDVMAGDNAILARVLVGGQWVSNTFNGGIQHQPRILLDQNSADAALVSGGDLMRGGGRDDLMYGQAGDDDMDGNEGDDFMEGNSDDDLMLGSADQDDMIGGTVDGTIWDGADTMYGGLEGDVMAGDNATIERPLASGLWQIDPNTLDAVRTITLLNVQVVGGPAANPLLSGSDLMYGNEGSDRMFGQGNDDADDDGDGLFNEDPTDGIDNDLDGRESGASTQYDCADGFDNDGDGQIDAADAQCVAKVDEDAGGDVMYGNAGHDFMEGNHGADLMFGNEDEDDMWGGSSSDGTGVVGSGTPPDNLVDTNDVMRGGEEDDILIGDNGTIVRATGGGGIWLRHQGPRANGDNAPFDMVVRNVGVTQTPEAAGAFGNDWMQGNDGEDEGYGQQGNDYMEGNNGEDALLGDLGLITSSVQDGSNQQTITPPGPFFSETIYPAGSFYRQFTLFSFTGVPAAAGNDIILGGDDRDSLHGADGNDIVNGDGDATGLDPFTGVDPNPLTADVDKVLGGDGADIMWGGRGDDNVWGGRGDDYLDVRPRSGSPNFADDPPLWHTFGRFDFYQGLDLIYGGWDRDAMQANVAAPGPRVTDRLIDWAGGYNVFYVCPGAYGEGTITRQGNPQFEAWMEQVIDADGAFQSATIGTSGFREFAYVFPNQRGQNAHPPHPDHPGHFTCDDGSVYVPTASQTLRAAALDLQAKVTLGRATVNGQATIKNDQGQAYSGATVSIIWTLPNGTSVEQIAVTDKKGIAKFAVSGPKGTYQALVSELALGNTTINAMGSAWIKTITTK